MSSVKTLRGNDFLVSFLCASTSLLLLSSGFNTPIFISSVKWLCCKITDTLWYGILCGLFLLQLSGPKAIFIRVLSSYCGYKVGFMSTEWFAEKIAWNVASLPPIGSNFDIPASLAKSVVGVLCFTIQNGMQQIDFVEWGF